MTSEPTRPTAAGQSPDQAVTETPTETPPETPAETPADLPRRPRDPSAQVTVAKQPPQRVRLPLRGTPGTPSDPTDAAGDSGRSRPSPRGHSRGRAFGRTDTLVTALGHITDRDWRLLQLLDEHGVLTTRQITTICFGAYTTADARLRRLFQLGLLDRFRRHNPRTGTITGWHWTIGVLGAQLVALTDGRSPPSPDRAARRRHALAASPRLAHLLGVNQLFVQLIGHARAHPGTGLSRWWSEQRTTEQFGQRIHPDGHGVWHAAGQQVGFLLEHDTGSEPVHRLVAKLSAYTRLTHAGGPAWPVLFWLHSATRAAHLATALATAPATPFAVALAARDPAQQAGLIDAGPDPAGPIWRLAGSPEPLSLHQLPCPHQPTGPLHPGLD